MWTSAAPLGLHTSTASSATSAPCRCSRTSAQTSRDMPFLFQGVQQLAHDVLLHNVEFPIVFRCAQQPPAHPGGSGLRPHPGELADAIRAQSVRLLLHTRIRKYFEK